VKPFGKHQQIVVHSREPFNAEAPSRLLRSSYITPRELFYVRNHGSVPYVDPARYRLAVFGLVERPLRLSLQELERSFPRETVVATIHCAGNRRDELTRVSPIPGEIPWSAGAIGNARWTGVPLAEVLAAAGVRREARHAAFTGLDEVEEEGRRFNFGGSIPLEKAMSPDVLLAYEMNGEPLPPEHGSPLRAVVGGYIGARSVKWLSGVELRESPSDNYFQTHAYRLLPPYATDGGHRGLMLGELSVNAAITRPEDGERVRAGAVLFQGYAIAGGGRRIERVDLSADGGRTWAGAELSDGHPQAWRFWEAELQLEPGQHHVVARALDSASNTQPEDPRRIWNLHGYVNNAWHGVIVRCDG
jgi:sulfite oxidase